MEKITDIFSYVSSDDLSLETLERAFYNYLNGEPKCFFNGTPIGITVESMALKAEMQEAVNELRNKKKQVALAKCNDEILAVIGYIDN